MLHAPSTFTAHWGACFANASGRDTPDAISAWYSVRYQTSHARRRSRMASSSSAERFAWSQSTMTSASAREIGISIRQQCAQPGLHDGTTPVAASSARVRVAVSLHAWSTRRVTRLRSSVLARAKALSLRRSALLMRRPPATRVRL